MKALSLFGKKNTAATIKAGVTNSNQTLAAPADTDKSGRSRASSSTRSTAAHVPAATRPRVSFRDEDDLDLVEEVYPALSNDEYDREPLERADKGPHTKELYTELAWFCEKEMQVHSKSKHTVKHAYLHGKGEETQKEIRRKLRELTLAKMGIKQTGNSMRF